MTPLKLISVKEGRAKSKNTWKFGAVAKKVLVHGVAVDYKDQSDLERPKPLFGNNFANKLN